MDRRIEATAKCAFVDALLALEELGCADVAARLRGRWADVPDPTGYLGEDGRRQCVVPHTTVPAFTAPSGEPI